jgi:EAL domain-containing protein (putative c-di-GMP-specific phosphodiesterase class I)
MSHPPKHASEPASDERWSAAQVAAVASAEAIAATAAAEVAAKAAATARAVVEVATAVAAKAAATASDVAARAAMAVAAAAGEELSTRRAPKQSGTEAAARAADKVAACVVAVAAAAAEAVVEARAVVGEQLASDAAAAADAVSVAAGALPARETDSAPRRAELTLAAELRRGLTEQQLRLHYQPIISLETGQPVGVEALVRWQHPRLGLLAPAEFMATAESGDLMVPLGAWVVDEACRFAGTLRQRGSEPLTVAVNLSGRQLSHPGLVQTVQEALDAHGCHGTQLVFEVTETALVTDMGAAIASLQALTAMGAGIAIDDFGTGYSSLLYLKHLPANDLKIDRSFVSGLGVDSHDTAIVASLISMAHNLDVRCVAEGVETEGQLELLTQLGCDLAQGYLFCAAVGAGELETWLDGHPTGGVQHHRWVARSPETPRILAMHDNGCSDLTIAAALNSEGNRPPGGLRWSAQRVAQIMARSRG